MPRVKKQKEPQVEQNITESAKDLMQRVMEALKQASDEYFDQNKILRKYDRRIIQGDDLKIAMDAAYKMQIIYNESLFPIFKFISDQFEYANRVGFDHMEFVRNIQLANDPTKIQPSDPSMIIDPNAVN